MTQHTPGPWRFDENRLSILHDYLNTTTRIAEVVKIPEYKANARLIEHAPELLEALELLVKDVAQYEAWNRPCLALDTAEAIIKKAKGE